MTESKPSEQKPLGVVGFIGVSVFAVFGGLFVLGGIQHDMSNAPSSLLQAATAPIMGDIHRQVADDSIDQYWLAKTHGNPVDAYVHAGMVCAAMSQAGDKAGYIKWKAIEKREKATFESDLKSQFSL